MVVSSTINEGDTKKERKTFFCHYNDSKLTLIHMVEHSDNTFQKSVEFRHYQNHLETYFRFSITIAPNIVLDGEFAFLQDKVIKGNFQIKILQMNSTSILDTFTISLQDNTYSIEHLINHTRAYHILATGKFDITTIWDLDIFLFNIISIINNYQSTTKKMLIPPLFYITPLIKEETNALQRLKNSSNSEAKEFYNHYSSILKRTRTKNI